MKKAMRAAFILASVLLAVGNAAAGRLQNVLIISIDALHPEALQRADIPILRDLMTSGAYTLDGKSTEPPLTLISHTAMFTGLSPIENGKIDNSWEPGQAGVNRSTIFNSAQTHGYKTGYFYSKQKLGYLVNDAVDVYQFSRDDAVDLAEAFIKTSGRHFVFLHISGLDETGPQHGWLSPEYLEELSLMDDYLSSIMESIKRRRNYLIIVTSDHAGHGKVHGSRHPEDYRLPFVISSDTVSVKHLASKPYSVVDLKKILFSLKDCVMANP